MAAEQTDKSRFKSRYGGGFVSCAQYLAELMCSRQAANKGEDLPNKFWNLPAWKRNFLLQVRFANGLLKTYEAKAILKALEGKEGKTIYSLAVKWLDPLIKQEQYKLEQQEEKPVQPTIEVAKDDSIRKPFIKEKSTIDKLRELDG